MRIAMISCQQYSDAWPAFAGLFDYFWPNCEFRLDVVSDGPKKLSWCASIGEYLKTIHEPVLLMQEDFFLCDPVEVPLIHEALRELDQLQAGCVRIYPCPGGTVDYGNRHFAAIDRQAAYRISCQAAIWDPLYLAEIASHCTTPTSFEFHGTTVSRSLEPPVLGFKRDVQPWPVNYLCSAITRGKWNPDAKRLCDALGITGVDWSRRPFLIA